MIRLFPSVCWFVSHRDPSRCHGSNEYSEYSPSYSSNVPIWTSPFICSLSLTDHSSTDAICWSHPWVSSLLLRGCIVWSAIHPTMLLFMPELWLHCWLQPQTNYSFFHWVVSVRIVVCSLIRSMLHSHPIVSHCVWVTIPVWFSVLQQWLLMFQKHAICSNSLTFSQYDRCPAADCNLWWDSWNS